MDKFSLEFENVYDSVLQEQINQEFSTNKGDYFLDHAGTTLYSKIQLENVFSDLTSNIFVNPHSGNHYSKTTGDAIDIIRYQILQHFNTNPEDYSIIFTSSATGALKLLGECFHYGDEHHGTFAYLENNHTSVLGMRNYASNVQVIRTSDAFEVLSDNPTCSDEDLISESNSCFVYPAQCNFSGTKYPLNWISKVQSGALNNLVNSKTKNWYVVLDAASFVATNILDLAIFKPDFVPISFYKIFGYPTGIGALLVRKGSENVLVKKYYGGGTVLMALSSENRMVPRPMLHDRFEDGTSPFLSILSIRHGFETLKRLSLDMEIISKHTFSLAKYVHANLATLHHHNGNPVATFYHDSQFENRNIQGGIVNFNLRRPDGGPVGYAEVLHMANLFKIILRTGCCCNPGACQRFLKLSDEDVIKNFKAGHVCGDENDLVDGHHTGSVRISFGYMSTVDDAKKFLEMIENCFISHPVIRKMPENLMNVQNTHSFYENTKSVDCQSNKLHNGFVAKKTIVHNNEVDQEFKNKGTLTRILLYPIKSCAAFSVDQWSITMKGLKYDREWMIVNSQGTPFTQKHNNKLCLLKPDINLEKRVMILTFPAYSNIEVPLDIISKTQTAYLCQSKVCKDLVVGWDCGDTVGDWLSECLATPGLRLLKQFTDEETLESDDRKLSFANKAQFLLVNSISVKWLRSKIADDNFKEDLTSTIERFRPNLVVELNEPFEENDMKAFVINNIRFENDGKCTRCQMICIDQQTGQITKEPLLTLSKELKGKISFGVYLKHRNNDKICTLRTGSSIYTK